MIFLAVNAVHIVEAVLALVAFLLVLSATRYDKDGR
jgi:hypothetical protein